MQPAGWHSKRKQAAQLVTASAHKGCSWQCLKESGTERCSCCVVLCVQSVHVQLVDVKGGKVEPNEHDMKQVRANCFGACACLGWPLHKNLCATATVWQALVNRYIVPPSC
jgi:hypothetical protein